MKYLFAAAMLLILTLAFTDVQKQQCVKLADTMMLFGDCHD